MKRSGEKLLLTLWVGGSWAIGTIAVPMLFSTLDDRALAGTLAAKLIQTTLWVAVVASALQALLWCLRTRLAALRDWRFGLLAAAGGGMLVILLLIVPEMNALRAGGESALPEFQRLHKLSEALYLAVAVLGLALVVFQDDGISDA